MATKQINQSRMDSLHTVLEYYLTIFKKNTGYEPSVPKVIDPDHLRNSHLQGYREINKFYFQYSAEIEQVRKGCVGKTPISNEKKMLLLQRYAQLEKIEDMRSREEKFYSKEEEARYDGLMIYLTYVYITCLNVSTN